MITVSVTRRPPNGVSVASGSGGLRASRGVSWRVAVLAVATALAPGARPAAAGPLPTPAEPAAPSEEQAEALFEKVRAEFEKEKGNEPWERMPTVEKFAGAPCQKTVDFLIQLYSAESNPGIHIAVSHALGTIGTLDAVKALVTMAIPLLASDDLALKEVERSLGHKFDTNVEEWIVRSGLTPEIRKNPKTYELVLRTIAKLQTPRRLSVLLTEIKRASPELQIAILEALRRSADASVARAVRSLVSSRSPEVQVGAYEVLASADPKAHKTYFVRGLKSSYWEVRALSVDALSDLGEGDLLKLVTPLLGDRDKRVQISVVHALMKRGGTEVIEPLFRTIDSSDPRVQDDIADALARLTGQNFGPVSAQWESWWVQNKDKKVDYKPMSMAEFARLKEEDRKRSKTVYFGLRVVSNHLGFLIDSSESMGEEYTPKDTEEKKEEEDTGGRTVVIKREPKAKDKRTKGNVTTKMDVAKKELSQVVTNLRDTQALNIFGFNTLITDFIQTALRLDQKRLVRLQAPVRVRAQQFIQANRPEGLTNLSGVIKSAMEYDELDTIYLLSDGAPTVGTVDHEELLGEVERLNRRRRVKINAISFDPKPEERQLLQALADQNYGVYVER